MELSKLQKESLLRDGYVVIPSVIPRTYMDHALRTINHALGSRDGGGRTVNWDEEMQANPAITDLFNRTPAFAILASLLGEGNFDPAANGQIALNFTARKAAKRYSAATWTACFGRMKARSRASRRSSA